MNISAHPVWQKVSSLKKPGHFLRFFLVKKIVKAFPRSRFIGITGSVGKTTTKELCLSVLSQKFNVLASRQNIDPIFNIPELILKMRPKTQKVILEMGVEYPGDMEFYLSLVRPGTAVVTRISFAHSEFLGDVAKIMQEKSLLISQLPEDGFAILNWDDINVRKMAEETKAQVIFYGLDNKNCHVWASNIHLEGDSNPGIFKTCFELNCGVERVQVTLNFLGRHFVYPALAAAALGIANGLSLINIKKGLEKTSPPPHRLQLLEGLEGWSVLDDCYNSSPVAVEEALNVLNELPAKQRVVVLGEMRELGIYSEQLHRAIAQRIYKDKFDLVLLGMGETKFIYDELLRLGYPEEKIFSNLSNSQIVSNILKKVGKGDIVLIKGSRAVKLEEVVARIAKIPRK